MDHWISAMTLKMQKWHAKDSTMSMQQLLDAETHQFLHSNKSDRGPTSSWKATKNIRHRLDSSGWKCDVPAAMYSSSSSSSRWQPSDNWWSTWNSGSWDSSSWSELFYLSEMKNFSLAGNLVSWQLPGRRREGVNSTPSAHTFFSCVQ